MATEAVNVWPSRWKTTTQIGSLPVGLAKVHGIERRVPETGDNRNGTKLRFEFLDPPRRIFCGIHQRGFRLREFVPQLDQSPMEDAKINLGTTNNLFAYCSRVRQQRVVSHCVTERYQLPPDRNMFASFIAVAV